MSVIEKHAERVAEAIDVDVLERMQYRLSDAIREGSAVSDQAYGWGDESTACALSAAYASAKARNYA
jgi:hypothetical protein